MSGSLSIADLFPPDGHRYFTDARIEELRQMALSHESVTLAPRMVIELVCDWRNMDSERTELQAARAVAEAARTLTTPSFGGFLEQHARVVDALDAYDAIAAPTETDGSE